MVLLDLFSIVLQIFLNLKNIDSIKMFHMLLNMLLI